MATPRVPRGPYDEVVVDRLITGHPAGRVRPADLAEAIRRLAGNQYSDGQTALLVGRSRRTVLRVRSRHRIPAGVPSGSSRHLPVDAPILPWTKG